MVCLRPQIAKANRGGRSYTQFTIRLNQGGKRPGGDTGSPLLVQCVMRRRTGTSAPSALPVQLMAAKNLLSTNRKWHFLSLFLGHQWPLFKGLFDISAPELNTILSVGTSLKYFRRKLLKFEWNKTVSNAGMSRLLWKSCAPLLILRVLHITPVQILHMLKIDSFYIT